MGTQHCIRRCTVMVDVMWDVRWASCPWGDVGTASLLCLVLVCWMLGTWHCAWWDERDPQWGTIVPCASMYYELLHAPIRMGGHGRHCTGGVVPHAGVVGIGNSLHCSLYLWVGVVWPSQASTVAIGGLCPFDASGCQLCMTGDQ